MLNSKKEVMKMLDAAINDHFQIVNATSGTNSPNSITTSYQVSNGIGDPLNVSIATQALGAISGSNATAGSNQLSTGGLLAASQNTPWSFWENYYYPTIIKESYPVYLQERAMDKGQKAFEIIKQLQDKKLLKLDKVSEFIEAMDALIKIL